MTFAVAAGFHNFNNKPSLLFQQSKNETLDVFVFVTEMYVIHSSPPKWQSYAEKIDDVSAAGIEEGMIHIGN